MEGRKGGREGGSEGHEHVEAEKQRQNSKAT